jgi:sigma-E factor negative regulatory protein RseA
MKEEISALMDGALDEDSTAPLLERFRSDDEALRIWDTYHLIGDGLRGDARLDAHVVTKVMSRVEAEANVVVPFPRRPVPNRLRWALPLAASVMGVGAVAWVSQSLNLQLRNDQTVARLAPAPGATVQESMSSPISSVAAVVSTDQSPIPIWATFGREYLIAHQAYSPGAKMSGVAQYVRTVSESRNETVR